MLNVRLTPTTTTPVKVPTAPTEAPITTPTPTEGLGTREDCKSELTALTGINGEIRAVFCELCEFGSF
ncbi:hypothetical protein [Streptomyces sp. NPDC006334]|uniref:hypothetical protein n=1 Tax=Streptomyces sp. NPDC006334 TaxID=3156754 RepID=UPI0033A58E1A